MHNPHIRHLWPLSNLLRSPDRAPIAARPVVNLSFTMNYALGGLDVTGYHAVNLAIHLLAALTLFGLVRRTFILRQQTSDLRQGTRSFFG